MDFKDVIEIWEKEQEAEMRRVIEEHSRRERIEIRFTCLLARIRGQLGEVD